MGRCVRSLCNGGQTTNRESFMARRELTSRSRPFPSRWTYSSSTVRHSASTQTAVQPADYCNSEERRDGQGRLDIDTNADH